MRTKWIPIVRVWITSLSGTASHALLNGLGEYIVPTQHSTEWLKSFTQWKGTTGKEGVVQTEIRSMSEDVLPVCDTSIWI